MSRSSLKIFKINRVEILTVLQAVNFVFWIMQAEYRFTNIWVQFVLMVYVGLLGGASYVNIFYHLLHSPKFSESDRELIINFAALWQTAALTVASLFTVSFIIIIITFFLFFLIN